MSKLNTIKVISPTLTIKAIEPGKTVFIPDAKIDKGVIRITISRLNKNGYDFTCSQQGVKGGIKVTNNSINL